MRCRLLTAVLLLLPALAVTTSSPPAAAAAPTVWTNPISPVNLRDPGALRVGSQYFMFGSFAAASAGGVGTPGVAAAVPVLTSTDLASWTSAGDALPVTNLGAWADPTAVADVAGPAVLPRPGGYVLYYSARDRVSQSLCIGAATATAPAGPYVGRPAPLVCDSSQGGARTPNTYVRGSVVELLWVFDQGTASDRIVARQLAADGLSFAVGSAPVTLLTGQSAPSAWEGGRLDNPAVVPGSDPPMLMYSASDPAAFTYGMNWATCTAADTGALTGCTRGQLGPWTWYQFRTSVVAPGGADFVADEAGAVWMAYTGVDGSFCAPDCVKAATPRLDKFCIYRPRLGRPGTPAYQRERKDGAIQPRTTAPSAGGALARRPDDCSQDVVTPAETWAAADALFKKDPQWRGGDGAHSIPIGNGQILWTFGDTFIDPTPFAPNPAVEWGRVGSRFIRNSAGIQTGSDPSRPDTTFKGLWLGGTTPTDLFNALTPGHWLWDYGGVMVGDRLLIWNGERSGPGLGVYDREVVVFVDAPSTTAPDLWVQQHGLPVSPQETFGFLPEPNAVFAADSHVYVYYMGAGGSGCDAPSGMRLARFSTADLALGDFSRREWWDGAGYRAQSTFSPCAGAPPVVANMTMVAGGSGGGVVQEASGRYTEYAGGALYGGLYTQSAPSPTGPWPGAKSMLSSPESTRSGVITYVWAPHPELTGVPAGTMWTTWNSNSDRVFYDETVYYPRFAKVTVP